MSETTALAVQSASGIVPDQGGAGLDGGSAIRPVPMGLKQPTTEGFEDVKTGEFFDKLSGITWKTVRLVPLKITAIRDKYPSDKFVKGEFPICRSSNGVVPITTREDLIPQAPNCKVCRHSSWDGYNNKTKTGTKPTCKESFLIIFLELETSLPFYIKIVGLSVKEAKKLKEAIERNAQIAAARDAEKKKPNLYDYVVDMTSQKGDGPYFDVKFPRVALMRPEDRGKFGPIYAELINRANQAKQEAATDDLAGEELGVEDGVEQI